MLKENESESKKRRKRRRQNRSELENRIKSKMKENVEIKWGWLFLQASECTKSSSVRFSLSLLKHLLFSLKLFMEIYPIIWIALIVLWEKKPKKSPSNIWSPINPELADWRGNWRGQNTDAWPIALQMLDTGG